MITVCAVFEVLLIHGFILHCWTLNSDQQSSGDSGSNVKRLEQETADKIEHLKTEASRISLDVVDMLLKYVTTVKN